MEDPAQIRITMLSRSRELDLLREEVLIVVQGFLHAIQPRIGPEVVNEAWTRPRWERGEGEMLQRQPDDALHPDHADIEWWIGNISAKRDFAAVCRIGGNNVCTVLPYGTGHFPGLRTRRRVHNSIDDFIFGVMHMFPGIEQDVHLLK